MNGAGPFRVKKLSRNIYIGNIIKYNMEKIRKIPSKEKERKIKELKRIIVEARSNPKSMRQIKETILNC